MTQITITAVNNRNLFSNYYLDNQIKSNPEWEKNDHIEAFNKIKKIYNTEFAFLETLKEKQLELRFFGPIFKILNHTIEVNEITEYKQFPDYAFFKDRNSLDDAHRNKGTNSFFNNAYAIGEVKRWGIELDRFGKDWDNRKRNPSLQIWIYLHDVTPKWGILTNGASWRLYCKERGRNEYYEIDLPTLLATDNLEDFRYFYYFFRREAFPFQDASPFLERVLQGSVDYANEIGDDLKENVYKAMKKLAEGFFNWSQNGLDIQNEEHRQIVQKNTMLLLYRFLFLLYAEGKGLLDVKHGRYQTYSFYQLKNDVKKNMDGPREQRYLPVGTSLWSKLNDLFRLINLGSKSFGIPENELSVPAYNGGLFDPEKNPELEKWAVGDTFLAEAVDLLSRSKIDEKLDFVDYSTLEIRHLGSVYEGLLEYKLQIAEEDMVVKSREWVTLEEYNKNRKRTVKFSDFDDFDKVITGQLYLATDKGERKATGSYYTPDYIVNYIVENTIGPVIEEKWKDASANGESFVDATLSVKVLDPAMGSGHFLVGAIEFLSGKLLLAVQNDIEAERIIDDAHYTPDWAHREVVAHCIYGVDLNEMAVELAKVSLWLTTISKDKPLSFLDHRLKQGNSLIGAKLSDIKNYPGTKVKQKDQTSLPSFISPIFITHLIGKIAELETISDETLEDIKKKEKVFEEFKQLPEYLKAKALANVYTGVYFGNEVTPTQNKTSANVYYDLFWAIMGDENEWRKKTNRGWFLSANQMAGEKSFFHWELEFPEIFFDGGAPKENPGWDAVVGNPPYVSIEKIDKKELFYLENQYSSAAYGRTDLYIVFIELSELLSKCGANFSMITPDKWLVSDYGELLRKALLTNNILTCIWDLRNVKVFEDATNSPIVFIANKSRESNNNVNFNIGLPDETNYLNYKCSQSLFLHLNHYKIKIGLTEEKWNLIKKINSNSDELGDFCYISYGAQPGLMSKFIFYDKERAFEGAKKLQEEQNFEKILKHFIKGGNIARYEINYDGGLMLYLPNKLHRPAFSELFENEKIVISEIANHLKGTYDDNAFYGNEKVVFVVSAWSLKNLSEKIRKQRTIPTISELPKYTENYNLRYITTLINSQLMNCYFTNYIGDLLNVYPDDVRQLPIRCISFTTPAEHRTAHLDEVKVLYSEYLGAPDSMDKLLDFVALRLAAELEESDVVHDLLAHLAEQMIEITKEKNEEIKSFLEWFEREIDVQIDSLTNKTKLKQYHELDFDELIGILKKNKRKIPINLSNREFQNNLKVEFDKSLSKLEPLKNKIEKTDYLIDRVVYKLYGLTKDEIRIIEESIP